MTLNGEGVLILVIILVMMIADVAYDGAASPCPGREARS